MGNCSTLVLNFHPFCYRFADVLEIILLFVGQALGVTGVR